MIKRVICLLIWLSLEEGHPLLDSTVCVCLCVCLFVNVFSCVPLCAWSKQLVLHSLRAHFLKFPLAENKPMSNRTTSNQHGDLLRFLKVTVLVLQHIVWLSLNSAIILISSSSRQLFSTNKL